MLKQLSIGIVGNGLVGSAHARGYAEYVNEIKCYDSDPVRTDCYLKDLVYCDFVFISVPTPCDPATGACQTDILEGVIEKLLMESSVFAKDSISNPIVVIKCTLPPGTTDRLAKHVLDAGGMANILHSPEFLTARCASADFNNPSRHIIGIPACYKEIGDGGCSKYRQLVGARFPGVPQEAMSSTESELVKLCANAFFSMKVGFFNEVYEMCQAVGGEDIGVEECFRSVSRGILLDGRITHSHCTVPGPDQSRGFGGMCFPKDLGNLLRWMEAQGLDAGLFQSLWDRNKAMRKNDPELPKF
jgi:nucleotide sugar dehydrogenase